MRLILVFLGSPRRSPLRTWVFKDPRVDSTESIPYNLAPLSVVMEQVTTQQFPLVVVYIRVLRGHCLLYNLGAGKYLFQIPNMVRSEFQESILPLLNPPKLYSLWMTYRWLKHMSSWEGPLYPPGPEPAVQNECYNYSLRDQTTLPTPLSPASVPLPQNRKGGAHSPGGEELGESQFRRLEKRLSTLPTLWIRLKEVQALCAVVFID